MFGRDESELLLDMARTLGDMFHDKDQARDLVMQTSFPLRKMPVWSSPEEFWRKVLRESYKGATPDKWEVFDAARKSYQFSDQLAQLGKRRDAIYSHDKGKSPPSPRVIISMGVLALASVASVLLFIALALVLSSWTTPQQSVDDDVDLSFVVKSLKYLQQGDVCVITHSYNEEACGRIEVKGLVDSEPGIDVEQLGHKVKVHLNGRVEPYTLQYSCPKDHRLLERRQFKECSG